MKALWMLMRSGTLLPFLSPIFCGVLWGMMLSSRPPIFLRSLNSLFPFGVSLEIANFPPIQLKLERKIRHCCITNIPFIGGMRGQNTSFFFHSFFLQVILVRALIVAEFGSETFNFFFFLFKIHLQLVWSFDGAGDVELSGFCRFNMLMTVFNRLRLYFYLYLVIY